jgi:hypothetical protein|tara:strand:- start:173 stop:1795 length:1623 start_codon:yes stop_codon:yes gene_type:complete
MANTDIFLGSGASITFIPENDIYVGGQHTSGLAFNGSRGTVDTIRVDSDFTSSFLLVTNLYKGCLLERYSSGNVLQSTHRISSNTLEDITFTPSLTDIPANDYFVIKSYGAPVPAHKDGTGGTATKRLLSDEWLGILESATFPTTEVEMKQTNLSLGGSRNFTYQYKGITSFSGGNLGIVANHGAWLYYFLGKCEKINATVAQPAATPTIYANGNSGDNNKIFIEATGVSAGTGVDITGISETGPLFFRQDNNNKFCPPLSPHLHTLADMDTLTRPSGDTTISNAITYTFGEQNGDLLPSFALENNFSKLAGSSNIYRTNTASEAEDLNFVKIARGCRVNTLTMTANENEEVKMTLDLNTRNVHDLAQDERYDARKGVEAETSFFNYESSTNTDQMREPFFFSDGTFKVLGESFLKINTLTLTMNNNLQDRRFLGVGSKDVQEAIPAQRTYEIAFTGHVTDDALYTALLNDSENTTQTIELIFTKSNGESITLKFEDYFVSANNFPMTDDKGPIVVEATVMPRNLATDGCVVKTHWVLQG